ncbi:cyclopropane fatty acyl phospholipid synthase [Candidatus Woesearchaeota archaeon]|nr:cyclopropane fatty acyl phospholipid synthase [Candidatus Woesearchaeota archaeon]
MSNKAKEIINNLLVKADIQINGKRPWDIQVYNEKFYSRVLSQGSLGLGEAYLDGWWDSKQLDEFFNKILTTNLKIKAVNFRVVYEFLKSVLLNMQSKSRSKKVAELHYDIGNDFYENMLGKTMQYTCAYWKNSKTLDQAQIAKLDLVCKKLMLKKGDKVLELGSGWGYFAKYAVENYGCEFTSYNISEEQVKYARELCKGLPVKIIQGDYREAQGEFDKVASIGMCEHVGYKNYKNFMEVANRCLKDRGLFLIHTIAGNKSVTTIDPWLEQHIFPGAVTPSVKQLGKAMEGLFVMEDWHNFGADYDKTLMAWFENFNKNWLKFKSKYDERFYRIFKYYLLCLAGSFRARRNQLWHVVLSKGGIIGGYKSVR